MVGVTTFSHAIILNLSGYGHIAPKTPVGKIVTIFYAIVGIPITVLCWSNIGDAMANAFRFRSLERKIIKYDNLHLRFTYWKICCYVYVKKAKKRRRRMLSRQRT